jgi:uncharacterized protein (DUF924 family)
MSVAPSGATSNWVADVLHFWFAELRPAQWFAKDDAVDATIRTRFHALHERLATGAVVAAASDDAGVVLAAVIVLDQFSRNLYRGSPRAYHADALARGLSRSAIERGLDRGLASAERLFLYMPLQHSEDLADQACAVELVASLGDEEWTRYARAHQAIIERFGRFPHRNAVLGRPSSPGELASLKEPGGAF